MTGDLQVRGATTQDDAGVQALFHALSLPIPGDYWRRAYAGEAPPGYSSRPFVAIRGGQVVGFCAARPTEFIVEGAELGAQVIHDLAIQPGTDEGLLLDDFLQPIISRAPLTLAGGTGPYLSQLLTRERWQPLGYLGRWGLNTIQWAAIQAAKPAGEAIVIARDLEAIVSFGREFSAAFDHLREERRIHRTRRPEALQWQFVDGVPGVFRGLALREGSRVLGFVVYREAQGLERKEWLVVDVAARLGDLAILLASFRKRAVESRVDVYLSVMCEEWSPILRGIGFEPLRPRWPVFWMLGGEQYRDIAPVLSRRGTWFLTPADLDLDRG